MWVRELTDKENELCHALGEIVVAWNHVEQSFRLLLHRAIHINGPDGRIWSLVAHLSPVQLKDSMIALSEDHEDIRKDHLIHCAKVFDRERQYRNYYVHGPRTFWSTDDSSELIASSLSVRGGNLSLRRSNIQTAELKDYGLRLSALQKYVGELIQDSIDLRGGQSLVELEKPVIAPPLLVERDSWWDAVKAQ